MQIVVLCSQLLLLNLRNKHEYHTSPLSVLSTQIKTSDINDHTHTGRWDGPFWLMTSMRACKWRDWAYSIRALIGFLFSAAKLSDVIFREGPELSPTGSDMGPDPNTGWLWDLVMIALSKDNGLLCSMLGLITFPMDRIHCYLYPIKIGHLQYYS